MTSCLGCWSWGWLGSGSTVPCEAPLAKVRSCLRQLATQTWRHHGNSGSSPNTEGELEDHKGNQTAPKSRTFREYNSVASCSYQNQSDHHCKYKLVNTYRPCVEDMRAGIVNAYPFHSSDFCTLARFIVRCRAPFNKQHLAMLGNHDGSDKPASWQKPWLKLPLLRLRALSWYIVAATSHAA